MQYKIQQRFCPDLKEIEYYDIPVEEIFHDACCLLDFCIFDEVKMFDETGKEYKELY